MNKLQAWRMAIQNSSLAATTRHVLLNLAVRMNSEGASCFPSTATQARETGLSERTVITHIDQAVAAGFLKKSVKGRSGKGWARHEYEATFPHGAEPRSAPKFDNPSQRTEPISAPQDERAERHDGKALNVVQPNSPENSYLWQGQVIKLTERDFRTWQRSVGVSDAVLAEYLERRDSWLGTRPEGERARWFMSTANDLKRQFRKSGT